MSWDPLISIASRLAIPVFIVGSFYTLQTLANRGQRSKKARLELVDPAAAGEKFALASAHSEWAEQNGFSWIGAYIYIASFNPRTVLCAWRRKEHLMVCYASGGRTVTDFETTYEADSALTTGSAAAAALYPVDTRDRKQAFPDVTMDELLVRHLDGDAFLRQRFGLRPLVHQDPFEQEFVRSVARTARRMSKVWLFPLRSFWWYATLKSRVNVPVSAQRVDPAFDPRRVVS